MKLPKWAQREIIRLTAEVTDLQQQLDALGNEGSAITWRMALEERHGIPERATIRFDIVGGEFEIMIRNGHLEVRTIYDRLVVNPLATNAIELSTER
jgi:hypothetical protein